MSLDARSLWNESAPELDDPEADTYTCPDCGTDHPTQAAEASCLRSHARAEADRLASDVGPASAPSSDDGRTLVTDGGVDVGEQTERSGSVTPGFKVRGMEPQRNIYDFQITIDADFADDLRALEVPENQEGAADHIEGALTHDMADVRFVGDSFLLRGLTVAFQATGLDLHKKERGRQTFATHNVDTASEAIEVIAAFGRWEDLANHLFDGRREDDGRTLVTDGGACRDGTEQLTETCQGCGEDYAPLFEGYFVDTDDVGEDATGGTAEAFRQDAEKFGEWTGFEEEDIGPWCENCSWKIQRKRTRTARSTVTATQQGESDR